MFVIVGQLGGDSDLPTLTEVRNAPPRLETETYDHHY